MIDPMIPDMPTISDEEYQDIINWSNDGVVDLPLFDSIREEINLEIDEMNLRYFRNQTQSCCIKNKDRFIVNWRKEGF